RLKAHPGANRSDMAAVKSGKLSRDNLAEAAKTALKYRRQKAGVKDEGPQRAQNAVISDLAKIAKKRNGKAKGTLVTGPGQRLPHKGSASDYRGDSKGPIFKRPVKGMHGPNNGDIAR